MLQQSLLSRYAETSTVVPGAGFFANFLGLRTQTAWLEHAAPYDGQHMLDLPVPDDRVYGTWTEYASLLTAIDNTPDRRRFTAIELGAGWGPWISAAGIVCQRLGFETINLVGVEADPVKASLIPQHLHENGLSTPPVNVTVIQAAAWSEDTTLYFPGDASVQDYGAGASSTLSNRDYRGTEYRAIEVPAVSLETITKDHDIIDYTHWDIQGAELAVAESSTDLLRNKFRYVMIGTHSRSIEGRLVELFFDMGWDLISDVPCNYRWDRHKPTIEGMTHSDGEMFFSNPHLT